MNHYSMAKVLDGVAQEVRNDASRGAGFDELFQLDLPSADKKVKHYKQVVPVSIHHFYLVEEIKEVGYYLNMINAIRTAERHDTVFVYLNTPGGNLHTAIQIIAAMRQSQATIVTCLEGEVCSAGTMIFLAGHKHLVSANSTFMIHNYSQGAFGKGNDLTNQVNYTATYFRKLANDIYGKFLTADEIELVLKGQDFWMESEEVIRRIKDKLMPTEEEAQAEEALAVLKLAANLPQEAAPVEKPAKKKAEPKPKVAKPAKKPKTAKA